MEEESNKRFVWSPASRREGVGVGDGDSNKEGVGEKDGDQFVDSLQAQHVPNYY